MPETHKKPNRAQVREQGVGTLLKKNAILLLSIVSSVFLLVSTLAKGLIWIIRFVFVRVARVGIRFFILPIYQLFKNAELKVTKVRHITRAQFGENKSRNTIIYGGLIALAIFTTTTNIKARELRPEEVGRNTALYTLLANQNDFELIVESSTTIDTSYDTVDTPEQPTRQLTQVGVQSVVNPSGGATTDSESSRFTQSGDALIRPDITGTDITPQERDSIITYVIEDGDTISEIADKFNVNSSTILWENKIGPRDFIKPGQELVILPVSGVTYTVTRGDTLTGIASRYRGKADDILLINKLADASELRIGAKIIIPDGVPPSPVVPQRDSSALADLRDIFKPAKAVVGKFNWPATEKRLTQYFRGWQHTGIDIGMPVGNAIYAAEDGIVTTAGWNSGGYGYYIIIDHGNGITTLYAHNSKLLVKKGGRVSKGEVIAQSGSTGRSTGPHLHFEIRVNGNRVNPLDYL